MPGAFGDVRLRLTNREPRHRTCSGSRCRCRWAEVACSNHAGRISAQFRAVVHDSATVYARPVAAEYRFVDRWVVPHGIEAVFDLVGDPLAYPGWWSDV